MFPVVGLWPGHAWSWWSSSSALQFYSLTLNDGDVVGWSYSNDWFRLNFDCSDSIHTACSILSTADELSSVLNFHVREPAQDGQIRLSQTLIKQQRKMPHIPNLPQYTIRQFFNVGTEWPSIRFRPSNLWSWVTLSDSALQNQTSSFVNGLTGCRVQLDGRGFSPFYVDECRCLSRSRGRISNAEVSSSVLHHDVVNSQHVAVFVSVVSQVLSNSGPAHLGLRVPCSLTMKFGRGSLSNSHTLRFNSHSGRCTD